VLADELFRQIEPYKLVPLNTLGQYHRDAQHYAIESDPIQDLPGLIATNVIYSEGDENIREGTTFSK
jgi:hypothetical protein